MKTLIFFGIMAFIVYSIFKKLQKSKILQDLNEKRFGRINLEKNLKKPKENIGKFYYLKKSLFTKTEYVFFQELQKQNNNEFIINSKVRLEDIVGVRKGIEKGKYNPMRNHIKSRHVDFVIVGQSGDILAVIELDDKSHESEKAKHGDEIKNQIFDFVGIKFYRVKVGEVYSEKIENIFEEIKRA